MSVWEPGFDMSTIPDEIFAGERSRRHSLLRRKRSGGIIWSVHRENYSRCRCMECISARAEKLADAGPKRPQGRPRKEADELKRPRAGESTRPQGRPRKRGTVVVPKTLRPRGRPRNKPLETNIAPVPPAPLDTPEPISHDVTQSGLSKYSR